MPRRFWASALAAAVVGLAGCGDDGSAPEGDAVLRVYVSLPATGDGGEARKGASLALEQAGGEAGGVEVEEMVLPAPGSLADVGENARAATQDSTAIAYLGDFTSGESRTSVPITNAAGMLQVSPASSATDLVDAFPGSDDVPDLQSSGDRTFGRVIPGDEAQARAAAAWTDKLDVGSAGTAGDGSEFSKDFERTFRESLTDTQVSRSSDLLLFTGEHGPTASLAQSFDGTQMTSDAGLTEEAISTLKPGTLATSAALDPSQLPPVADEFVGRFVAKYGRPPGRYAAYGYEAMAVILDSIDRASDPADRSAVVDAFFDTADRESIFGTYSIAEDGQTTFDHMTGYEVTDGQAKPVEFLDPN